MAPASAKGVQILKGNKPKWKVGDKIGSGACATVHALDEIDGTSTEYAIKLTQVPVKKTKKQSSKDEVNDRLLHHEHLMYCCHFQDIQGELVPKLPSYKGPPTNGEADGYRFLVMERMDSPLSDVITQLLKSTGSRSSKAISFGPVAVQLLACVQAIHERSNLVVDIKPENFMLASGTGKGSSVAQKLASRIRILDLALVQPLSSVGSHRANEGTSGLAGTPLYASLNVHERHTPSRRDDMEALGYVLAELIMQLAAGSSSEQLPWSKGKSDEEIGELKARYIDDPDSVFYKDLGTAAQAIRDYLYEVRSYSFKKKPDYEGLASILEQIRISKPITSKTAAGKATATKSAAGKATATKSAASKSTRAASNVSATSGTKRMTRSQSAQASKESPKKMARDESYMETEVVHVEDSEDDDSFVDAQPLHDAESEADDDSFVSASMDWEPLPDENENPVHDTKMKAAVGVTIVVEGGPHKGLAMNLIQGRCESIVVGKDPVSKRGEATLLLDQDEEVDDSHIRVDLGVSKKLISVNVYDLKSTSGSFVGSEKIQAGNGYRLFRGGSVRIGDSLLQVKNLDVSQVVNATPRQSGRSTKKGVKSRLSKTTRSEPEPEAPRLKRRGVHLVVTEGPHEGESFELEHGGVEGCTVGSKPTGSKRESVSLHKDKSLLGSHVRLDLDKSKKFPSVRVTDKSKGKTVVNRDAVTKGRAFINDRIKIGNSVLHIQAL